MIEHTRDQCADTMRWRFCVRHDTALIAVPIIAVVVSALNVLAGRHTVTQVMPVVFLGGVVVPVSVWLVKQLPKTARRNVIIAVAVIWVVLTVLLLFVLSDLPALLKR